MSAHGHNGGPPLIDDDDSGDVRMRYARIHISDFLNGIRKLPLEARGFYVTGLFCMYDNMGSLPADDRMAALQMNCDIRTYRRMRSMMLDAGAFGDSRARWVDTGEGLSHKRVQDEISDYCREFRNRRDAALRREADKRAREEAAAISPIPANADQPIGPIGPEKQPEISPLQSGLASTPAALPPTKSQQRADKEPTKLAQSPDFAGFDRPDQKPDLSRKANDFNGSATTAVPERAPQPDPQDGGHPKHKHKQKEEREEKGMEDEDAGAIAKRTLDELERKLVDACNGALDNPANSLGLLNLAVPQMWLREGCDLDLDVIPTLSAVGRQQHGRKRIRGWEYFSKMVVEARDRRLRGLPDSDLLRRVEQPRRRTSRDGTYRPSMAEIAEALNEIEGN